MTEKLATIIMQHDKQDQYFACGKMKVGFSPDHVASILRNVAMKMKTRALPCHFAVSFKAFIFGFDITATTFPEELFAFLHFAVTTLNCCAQKLLELFVKEEARLVPAALLHSQWFELVQNMASTERLEWVLKFTVVAVPTNRACWMKALDQRKATLMNITRKETNAMKAVINAYFISVGCSNNKEENEKPITLTAEVGGGGDGDAACADSVDLKSDNAKHSRQTKRKASSVSQNEEGQQKKK